MTPTLDDVAIRPLAGPDELPLFLQLSYVLDHELADDLATGRRLPEWMWVALGGDRLLGRIAWWTKPGGRAPQALDFFDLAELPEEERATIGLRLLATATAPCPGGHAAAGVRPLHAGRLARGAGDPVPPGVRLGALGGPGARPLVERLRLEWRSGTPVPEPKGRLEFRPVRDREDLVALMTPVMEGTLDAHGQADLASGISAAGRPRAALRRGVHALLLAAGVVAGGPAAGRRAGRLRRPRT